jgi:hypothetical protein
MTKQITCEFPSVDHAELGLHRLRAHHALIKTITLTCDRPAAQNSAEYTPMAIWAGGFSGGSFPSAAVVSGINEIGVRSENYLEPMDSQTAYLNIECSPEGVDKLTSLLINMGALNVKVSR